MRLAHSIMLCALSAPPWAIAASGIEFQTGELPRAIKGVSYSAPIRVLIDGRCPHDNIRFYLTSGAIPPGLHFGMAGLEGIPLEMGLYQFRVHAANSCSSFDGDLKLLVTGKPILQVFPEAVELRIEAGETSRRTESVLVSSTWWELPYLTSEPLEPWLAVRPSAGVTPEQRSALTGDRLIFEIDPSRLTPGVHRQVIRVTAWQAANSVPVEIVVTVLPKT